MLQIQNWHRPYAELLLETDAVKRAALISRLEQEIVNRHLEHSISPITPDEQLDLMNAADVLRLKKNEIMALIKQRFIASKLGTARSIFNHSEPYSREAKKRAAGVEREPTPSTMALCPFTLERATCEADLRAPDAEKCAHAS